jgi:hemolysin activation/secretion protein
MDQASSQMTVLATSLPLSETLPKEPPLTSFTPPQAVISESTDGQINPDQPPKMMAAVTLAPVPEPLNQMASLETDLEKPTLCPPLARSDRFQDASEQSTQLSQIPTRPSPADTIPPTPPEAVPLPTETPVLPADQEAPVPSQPQSPDSPRVEVREIQVVGSTVFDQADFAPVLTAYLDRALTLEELRQAADAVTQLYLNEGYITSRAILANQTITDGVVQLQIIEGSLEEIRIEGTDRLANYVRDRISLGAQTPLSQADLEDQLRLLRADPLIENIEASLRAGEGTGQSILIVRVSEAKALVTRLILDTNSPPSVGTVRMGADMTLRNPLGIGDQLRASAYRATTGGSELYELSYRAPVNAMNGTVTARLLPSYFKIIDPANLAAFDIRGAADVYELSFRQPLIRTPREEFALSLGFRHRNGQTLLSGINIDQSRTSVVQFGQDYLRRDVSGAWALRSQLNLGTDLFDATRRLSPLPDGHFFSWLGQVQRAQVLSDDHLLILQADLQLASDSLLGSEQFVIGGAQSVRGYSQNARFGDNGLRLSIEDRIVVQRDEAGVPIMQISPFLDLATVWNTHAGTLTNTRNFLLGTGVGVSYQPLDNFNMRLDLGVPLVELNEAGDSPQDVFIYLSLDYAL